LSFCGRIAIKPRSVAKCPSAGSVSVGSAAAVGVGGVFAAATNRSAGIGSGSSFMALLRIASANGVTTRSAWPALAKTTTPRPCSGNSTHSAV
jgi:hypothetical protein